MGEPTATGWSRPLRVHLAIVMVSLLIGVSGLIAGLHFAAGRKAAIALAGQHMRVLSERLVENYRLLSAESVMFVEVAAIADEFQLPPPDRLNSKIAYLRLVVDRSAHVDGAYVGYPNGEFVHVVHLTRSPEWRAALGSPAGAAYAVRVITSDDDGRRHSQWTFYDGAMGELGVRPETGTIYDPRLRPWYRLAANQRDTVSVPPYTFATTRELGMTVAKAHNANRTIVFGVDVVLSTLSRFLDASQVAKGAMTLVVAPDGNVLIRSGAQAIDAAPLLGLARANTPPGTPPSQLTLDGQTYLVSSSAVDFENLLKGSRILVAAPLAALTRSADRALWRDLAIAVAILALGVLVALILARRIAKALRKLTREANGLKDLLLVPPARVRTRITEIAALGRAMTGARNAINGFGLYVPVEIVRRILDDGRYASRSASRQEVTALFTDIADFTTISERIAPEDVVAMLSAYFDRIHHVVLANNGVLIQFLGDSVFALWNAPVADPRHAERACRCAVDLVAEIESFNREQEEQGLPPFRTRVGIHTGPAVVGSVGAEARLQYTAMGDTINLASRLEGINKTYGTAILVSETTAARCSDAFVFRKVDTVQAKGRSKAVTVYELKAARAEAAARKTPETVA